MRRAAPTSARSFLIAVAIACAGCSGGGGGGSRGTDLEVEPNEGLILAHRLTIGRPVKGDVIEPEDEDWFQLRLTEGRTVKVELFATRLEQALWEATGNVPRLTIFFPDETQPYLQHSFSAGWPFGAADFDIPAFTAPQNGTYWFVVRADTDLSAGGPYALRVSNLQPAPAQEEAEEMLELGVNDSPGTAQQVQNGALTGHHRDGNDDYYKFQIGAPRTVRAEIVGQRNGAFQEGAGPYDPLLRLLDVDGSTILAENDDAFLLDPGVQHHLTEPGTYYLQVTQSPLSTEDGPYLLQFSATSPGTSQETEPNDTSPTADTLAYGGAVEGGIVPGQVDWYRFQADPGDMVRLQVFDVATSTGASEPVDVALFAPDGTTPIPFHVGPEFQVMTTILQQNGPFFARVQPGPASVVGTEYRLELSRFHASVRESEPNDLIASADPFPGGRFGSGTISLFADRDLWRFNTTNDELVTFVIYAGNASTVLDGSPEYSGHGSVLDPLLTIRDGVGGVVATSTSQPPGGTSTESVGDLLPTAAVTFVAPPSTHVFYLEVTDVDSSGANDHTYVVERR